jgi:tRNA A37 N6-isopentenylltransferase MiaA
MPVPQVRRVRRSLEITRASGGALKHSELLRRQAEAPVPPPPYSVRVIRLRCDRGLLNTRLDARVDGMVCACYLCRRGALLLLLLLSLTLHAPRRV